MPDPTLILEALAAAALTAAAVLLFCAWPWRAPHAVRASVGSIVGVGLGFFVGCWLLELRPHWPPREDQDRLLLILFPALMLGEVVAALIRRFPWLVWLLRIIVAAGAARVLLHNTSYLTELAGPGTREWTPAQTWGILGGLAATLAGVWALLVWLRDRAGVGSGLSISLAVAVACAGAAVTIMLSGYASGGEMGLPLAGALAGTVLASLALMTPPDGEGMLGLGIVGLYALLIMGHFFGQLAVAHAALLFVGTLLCWIPELPYLRRLGPRLRGLIRVLFVAVPVAVALALAQQKFVSDSIRTSPGSPEPSIQDYMDFGK
jgi:hypothetical protein